MTTPKKSGRRKHVYLDDAAMTALNTISAVLRAQGGQGGTSTAIRYAALRVAKTFQADL